MKGKKAKVAPVAAKSLKSKSVTLAEVVGLAADALAVAVYKVSAAQRRVVQAVLKA